MYKCILGGRLNLEKSINCHPIGWLHPLPGFHRWDAKLLSLAKSFPILGIIIWSTSSWRRRMNWNLSFKKSARNALTRVTAFFPWVVVKVILLKHMLRALPIYSLMMLEYTQCGIFQKIETICREFLWRYLVERKTKHPLVAWDVITKPYHQGRLAFQPFSPQLKSLRWGRLPRFFINTTLSGFM